MLSLCFIITKYIYLIYLFSILLLYGMLILFCSTLSLYSPSNHPAVSSRAQRPWEWETIDWGLWNHEHLEIFLLLSWFVSGILSKQCSLPTVSLNSDGTLLISLKIGWMSLSTIAIPSRLLLWHKMPLSNVFTSGHYEWQVGHHHSNPLLSDKFFLHSCFCSQCNQFQTRYSPCFH